MRTTSAYHQLFFFRVAHSDQQRDCRERVVRDLGRAEGIRQNAIASQEGDEECRSAGLVAF
jgi:hypothetical protein